MDSVRVFADFSSSVGKIKPMHSVNNGPAASRGMANDRYFTEAGFPFARNHDAAFCAAYGGSHTVDIIAIFPNFDADENDPASYDFQLTDEYCARIQATGTKVFYRLGNKIEHESKKYGAIPPKDFAKWARICEHIIRHLNEGWADGHHMNIEYWEIWNEPDLMPQCWTGTPEQYYELYTVAATHLKKCFPHLHIGGPAITSVNNRAWLEGFLTYITAGGRQVPMDFFSFHRYSCKPKEYGDHSRIARELLDKYGYPDAELILNEWNFVTDWNSAEYFYSVIPSLKGSAFVACSMIEAQHSPLDHFMYYDARRGTQWNGLFHHIHNRPEKPYYAMYAWNQLYKLGYEMASVSADPRVCAVAAKNEDGSRAAILISYYRNHESIDGSGTEEETLEMTLEWTNLFSASSVRAVYRVLDGAHDLEPVSGETFGAGSGMHIFRLPLYTTLLVELEADIPAEEIPWNLTLVNRENYLDQNRFIPLTRMPGAESVDSRIVPELNAMIDAAAADGVQMYISWGYRSIKTQRLCMNNRITRYKMEGKSEADAIREAETWVAIPGTSEHELGLAVDMMPVEGKNTEKEAFDWLAENAWRFGFILRYPQDKTEITRIGFEPWHYRYVGKDHAKKIHDAGICLEEYLQK